MAGPVRERDENNGLLLNPQVASGLLENSTVKVPTRLLEFSEAKERNVGEWNFFFLRRKKASRDYLKTPALQLFKTLIIGSILDISSKIFVCILRFHLLLRAELKPWRSDGFHRYFLKSEQH